MFFSPNLAVASQANGALMIKFNLAGANLAGANLRHSFDV